MQKLIVFLKNELSYKLLPPAAVNSLTQKGVKIFAIGVGKATVSELKKLAFTGEKSNTKDVFYADNYADAKRFTSTLVSLICKNVE